MQAQGMTSRRMQSELGNAYCGTGLYKQNISRARATRLAEVVQSETIAQLATSDLYWDAIVSINLTAKLTYTTLQFRHIATLCVVILLLITVSSKTPTS